jgi:hypothetical protein
MAEYDPKRCEYLTVDEIMLGAVSCTISRDVQRQLRLEEEAQGPLDPDRIRAAEDWSELANLIVGQEHLGPQTFP